MIDFVCNFVYKTNAMSKIVDWIISVAEFFVDLTRAKPLNCGYEEFEVRKHSYEFEEYYDMFWDIYSVDTKKIVYTINRKIPLNNIGAIDLIEQTELPKVLNKLRNDTINWF